MSYKIVEINRDEGWIRIEVNFDDGTVYKKKMMAPLVNTNQMVLDTDSLVFDHENNLVEFKEIPYTPEDYLKLFIEGWLSEYIKAKNLEKHNFSNLLSKPINFDLV